MYIQVSTLWGLPVYPLTTMQGTNGSSDLALHPTDPPHDSAVSRSQESHKSLGQRCAPVMECKFEGGKFDDFIVQDPYLFLAGGTLVQWRALWASCFCDVSSLVSSKNEGLLESKAVLVVRILD